MAFEVSVSGAIQDSQLNSIRERLTAICVEEKSWSIYECVRSFTTAKGNQSELRESARFTKDSSSGLLQWTIQSTGAPSIDGPLKPFPVAVRSVSEAIVSIPTGFLEAIGYGMEFELIKEGQMFLHPKNVFIYVYYIKRYLVEAVAVASESSQKQALEAVRFVAKQLSSIVLLQGVSQKELFEEQKRLKESESQ